jgi:phospholipid/cholesterol/gamma-HCH transport system substrate-binding protein
MTSFRDRNPVRIGIVSILVLGALLLLAFSFKRLPFISGTYKVTAEFADAAGLIRDNEVRVAGIKVGRVGRVELGRDRVLVTLEIRRGIEIPKRSTAEIALKTLLGTKFIFIDATKPGAPLEDGDRIPLEQTSIPFEIYQVANSAVDLLTDVDGNQLNDAFKALADVTADPNRNLARTLEGAGQVLGTLGGKREAIDTLIRQGEKVLEALDASTPDIQRIIEHSNVVMEVLARRRGVVQALLRNTELLANQLGTLLRDKRPELDTILDDLHATLKIVDASLAQLQQALNLVGPSSEAFARIVWKGRWAQICTMALEANIPPLPPVTIGTGEPGDPDGPVDCTIPPTTSASARTSRPMTPRAGP